MMALSFACGSSTSNPDDPSVEVGATLTVLFPPPADGVPADDVTRVAAVDYELSCETSNALDPNVSGFAVTLIGTLEQLDSVGSFDDGVWGGSLRLSQDTCALQLEALDASGEVVCSDLQMIEVNRESTQEVFIEMDCGETCPPLNIPDLDAAPKQEQTCAPVAGLVVSVETIEGSVDSVRLALELEPDGGGSGVTMVDDDLERVGRSTTDFGQGVFPTDVWRGVTQLSPSDASLLITGVGPFDEPLCSIADEFTLTDGQVTYLNYVLLCDP